MSQSSPLSKVAITRFFKNLPDPRCHQGKVIHPLINIVVIALCATIAGADEYETMVEFATIRRAWFAKFLDLTNGIPSHDTLGRVFANLDPIQFQRCLLSWIKALHESTEGKIIAIDGKAARQAMNRSQDKGPLCLVTAWASANHMLLGQVAGPEGSNELGALPPLLDLLDLQGAIVTLDALGCQKDIVCQIVDKGGNYLIAVKGNQEKLQEVVQGTILEVFEKDELKPSQTHRTEEKTHGRMEERIITVIEAPKELVGKEEWKGIKSFVMAIRNTTGKDGKTETGIRYYVSSLLLSARKMSEIVRGHWGIENGLHWVLDVAFGEDLNRARQKNAQANLGVLRRVAVSMIKNTPNLKGSMKSKRHQAGWNEKILEAILFG